jgi:hypothetical protein
MYICSCYMFWPHTGHHQATVIIWGDHCTVHFVLRTCNVLSFRSEELLSPQEAPKWRTTLCRLSATAYCCLIFMPTGLL